MYQLTVLSVEARTVRDIRLWTVRDLGAGADPPLHAFDGPRLGRTVRDSEEGLLLREEP
jgi:hypothetical protein